MPKHNMPSHSPFLLLWLLLASFAISPAADASQSQVNYDKANDRISVQASETSLQQLFGQIALQTGVEIVMDPEAEKTVSVSFEKQPLHTALKRMARLLDLNHMLIYGRLPAEKVDGEPLVVGMKVLPRGESTGDDLKPVVTPYQEAVHRARTLPTSAETPNSEAAHDYTDRRWLSRLDELPEMQRRELEALTQRLQEKRAELETRRIKREAKRDERRAARLAREEALRAEHPERYE